VPDWTVTRVHRGCDPGDNKCIWYFGVDTHVEPAVQCEFKVLRGWRSGASRSIGYEQPCSKYKITSQWSGQFAPDGFTVLSIVDYDARQIIWAGYDDDEIAGGKIVVPDKSYQPEQIP
jgi:hypothetical protein